MAILPPKAYLPVEESDRRSEAKRGDVGELIVYGRFGKGQLFALTVHSMGW
jgi:hypothetical protein